LTRFEAKMSDDGGAKMAQNPPQSLRKHRQTIIGGKPPPKKLYELTATSENEIPGEAPVERRDRDKIGHLVKNRLSSRIPLDQLYNQQNVPDLPANASDMILEASGPLEYHNDRVRRVEDSGPLKQPQVSPDKVVFLQPDFNAEAFISGKLSSATEVEISEYANELSMLQGRLEVEKKDAMYNNYRTVLSVGSQISGLGSELETLRRLLSDLHTVTAAIKDDGDRFLSTETQDPSRKPSITSSTSGTSVNGNVHNGRITVSAANRSSMIMLENMWQRDLASLFRHVEGAQKYLPMIPGRHVVRESGGWYQLNAATRKAVQPVHLFLLNDHLLVATKKRQRRGETSVMPSSGKLVADQCWPLLDIDIRDLASSSGETNGTVRSLCISSGRTSYVYRTENEKDHDMIWNEFVKAREELRRLRGSMRKASHPRNPSISNPSVVGESPPPVEINPRVAREVDRTLSELDVKIAHRQFPQVVDLMEKSHRMFISASASAAAPTAMDKLDRRIASIVDVLLEEIANEYLSREEIRQTVRLLVRLKATDAAKRTLLDSRRALLRRRVKQVDFQGDISNYVSQVAIISLQLIASTVEIYRSSFADPQDASRIVEWANEEVLAYAMLFARQLHNVSASSHTYKQCNEITRLESSHLEKLGLDLGSMLGYLYEKGE
jgi:hypothetical protein